MNTQYRTTGNMWKSNEAKCPSHGQMWKGNESLCAENSAGACTKCASHKMWKGREGICRNISAGVPKLNQHASADD